ncbi:immunoglobulin superfamily member 3-like [Sebastes umbrosus]|uniref:immunoglobulin superfamily member 3-like n=1 Tax=Sebastes umbrosus TaxID=72105 RepID=UPI00189E341F|nr:immunoglobulin superfamily member 3-like [Sebastes umbrosus]
MKCSLQSLLRANLLFCLGLLLHWGEASVHTEVQAGPLYRMVGSPLSISCNVSGFANNSTQKDIEFRITKPANTNFEINIISSGNSNFGYAGYTQRVRNKGITLTHLTPNTVLFEIKSLEKGDEGEYHCSVINPPGHDYYGTYSATTKVKVIDNSLSVSSPAPTSLNYNEGDALTFTCQASSNTVQHTHLSLAWYLCKEEDKANAQPIISLDRDFTLNPGSGFEGRYQAGQIRLDKTGEATYKLNMAHLELSDQGRIYCQAQEWIQDPDRSWYTIAQKDAEETTLNVKAREVAPDTSSLVVRVSAQSETLQEGQELSLSCNVVTQNLKERFFSVAWLRGSVELARIGPTGILTAGPEYSGRVKEGELRAARTGDGDYRLILQPVRTEDQGEYICRAWLQDRGQDGTFTPGAAQDSSSQLVSISATESGLSVKMQNTSGVNEGDRLELTCKVQGVKGQLSVAWQRKSTSAAAFTSVVSLSQEGVMEKAQEFTSRKVKAMRPAIDTFTLELDEVTLSDAGVYQCAVSEWMTNSKTNSQSQNAAVTVAPTDSFVKLSLKSRNNVVTVGEDVGLMCLVKGPRVPITLTWSLQRDASTLDNILVMYSDGAISWSGDQHRYQLKVENNQNGVVHYLIINGASRREAGSYQCSVSVFLENVHKKLPPSNLLAVLVQDPVSKLKLTTTPTLTRNINTDIEIKCSVSSEPSASSRYAVTWLLHQQAGNKTIVSSDQDALVTFGPQVQLSQRQRISMKRTKGPSFELSIRQARTSDGGSYVCEVVECLQDPHGDWYQLSPVSKTTKLTVIEPANDLSLDKEQPLPAMEGDEVELKCNITSGASGPSFLYKIAWLYTGHDGSTKALVELDHRGLLSYPKNQELTGLQGRLRLSRPTQSSFSLGIQSAREGDSGTYQCQVEQYQLDEGRWQQKASDSTGPITLTVNVTENNLSILKEEKKLNMSSSQDLLIPCHITKQSSTESEFQVTWLRQKETETEQPIFTAYRNSTFQDRFGKGDQLRFGHPLPNHFSLTVLKPSPEDSGRYFCEVEEWLPSLSRGWMNVAVEKSGYLTVNVYAEGDAVSEAECKSNMWMGILIATVICSLLVVVLLVLKMCWGKGSGGKKSGTDLWTEEHPLNTKPSGEI